MESGVTHDVCAAVHPLGLASPALSSLPLTSHGLRWVHPDVPLAHPLEKAPAALLQRSMSATAVSLGPDARAYMRMIGRVVDGGHELIADMLSPLRIPPGRPVQLARFAFDGIRPASKLAQRFTTSPARALLAGLSAHSAVALTEPLTGAFGLMLGAVGHLVGWPVAEGGSRSIATALIGLLESLGGRVECGQRVGNLADISDAQVALLDVSPRQLVEIAGDRLADGYRRRLLRFRPGPGVFKMDWVLDGPVPWDDPEVSRAGTVHVGGTIEEIVAAEFEVAKGRHPRRPFVLVAQQSLFDRTRATEGREALWGYCHVPNGSAMDMTDRVEAQIERFAPGFRDRIVARRSMLTADLAGHNQNYLGGDITGGASDLRQFVARPTFGLHPWSVPISTSGSTTLEGLYLCSASTPPGAGVHGMCGWHAAQEVLRNHR